MSSNASFGVMPVDDNQKSLQMAQKLRFQDASQVPTVSPTTTVMGTLTLVPPAKSTFLHIRGLTLGLKFGEGSLNGTSGNGYGTVDAEDWVALPVRNESSVMVKTTTGADTPIEFFFETLGII